MMIAHSTGTILVGTDLTGVELNNICYDHKDRQAGSGLIFPVKGVKRPKLRRFEAGATRS